MEKGRSRVDSGQLGDIDEMARMEPIKRRSLLQEEFAIRNSGRNNSCFLNVALQSLWAFPAMRLNVVDLANIETGKPDGLRPLICAVQKFYKGV